MRMDVIYDTVAAWQSDQTTLRLTCQRNSRHRPLVPVICDGIVELWCLDCDYIQDHIPDTVTGKLGAMSLVMQVDDP